MYVKKRRQHAIPTLRPRIVTKEYSLFLKRDLAAILI
jgi:hypothetical protein